MSRKGFDKSTWAKHTKGIKLDLEPTPERIRHQGRRKPKNYCTRAKGSHQYFQGRVGWRSARFVWVDRRCAYCGHKDIWIINTSQMPQDSVGEGG